jgi:hypothetical protein
MIDGVKVEIMGDAQLKRGNCSWEEPVNMEHNKRTLEIKGIRIPVMSLEHEYQVYVKLRRMKKAGMLRKCMSSDSSSV